MKITTAVAGRVKVAHAAAERPMPDAVATFAAYSLPALWLSSLSASGPVLQLAGLGAGTLVTAAAVGSLLRRIPRFSTPADRVTLLRAVLVALCAVVAVPQLLTGRGTGLLLPVLGGVAFLLDGVDGAVARRTGTASAAGARFDAATDAALLLILSIAAAATVGPWTLLLGAMYYGFVAAGFVRPRLRGPLPPKGIPQGHRGLPAARAAGGAPPRHPGDCGRCRHSPGTCVAHIFLHARRCPAGSLS